MQDFRDLKVWQKAHLVALRIYRVTREFPAAELYGLTWQMRRGATSVGANVAEGCGRATGADFARFPQIAMGSASELEYHLMLARDLELLHSETGAELLSEVAEVKRMLTALRARVAKGARAVRKDRQAPPSDG